MNNQNQTNDSLFTEIELNEAANVNGGYSTYSSYYLSLMNRNLRSRTPFSRGYNSSGFSTSAGYALYLMNLRRR